MPRVQSDRGLGLAALTVGAIALFISLNGDAWAARAAASLSKGSVKSVHIADSTIRSADIATGGVRGTDVKNGTLGLLDLHKTLAAKIVSGGPSGPAGPAGAAGPAGSAGPIGPPGPGVADGSITTARLADDAVTSAKVAPDTITSSDIATEAIGNEELAADAVGGAEVLSESLGGVHIADHTLTAADFGKVSGTVQFDNTQAAGTCTYIAVNAGQSVVGDVLVATPSAAFPAGMVHSTVKAPLANNFFIQVCNVTGALINPDPTTFSWVVLDA